MRSFLVNQGKGTWDNTFVSNDNQERNLPLRSILSPAVKAHKPYRPEGDVVLEIQHHFPISDPNNPYGPSDPQQALEWIGETLDSINLENPPSQNMGKLADALTAAGRWLANPPAPLGANPTPQQTAQYNKDVAIAAANQDMVNFRVDWVRFGETMYTRGVAGRDNGLFWAEIIHLEAFVSQSALALPN